MLFEAYVESPATWRPFAAVKSANDFKDHTGIRPSDTGDLTELPPGGEVKHGSVKEATYKYSIDTFGKMLSIDRRDIINDDLSLFDDTARSLGRSAMHSLTDLVDKVLLGNAGSFFSGGHGNALDDEAIGIAPGRQAGTCRAHDVRGRDVRDGTHRGSATGDKTAGQCREGRSGDVAGWGLNTGHERTDGRCGDIAERRGERKQAGRLGTDVDVAAGGAQDGPHVGAAGIEVAPGRGDATGRLSRGPGTRARTGWVAVWTG